MASTKRSRSKNKFEPPKINPPKVAEGAFIKESPLKMARRYAELDLGTKSGNGVPKTTPAQALWLLEHPYWWYRALAQIQREVESHIGKAKMDLRRFAPPVGENHNAERHRQYKAKLAEVASIQRDRQHFLQLVKTKREQVKARFGEEFLSKATLGDIIDFVVKLDQILEEDDIISARNSIAGFLKTYGHE